MDGMLAIHVRSHASPLRVTGQNHYRNRFPFVVTHLAGDGVDAEEFAFPTESAGRSLDVVRVLLKNSGPSSTSFEIRLSGKHHNLPVFANGAIPTTRDGYHVVLAQASPGTFSALQHALTLDYKITIPRHSTATLWLKRPYSLLTKDAPSITAVSGLDLLKRAVQSCQSVRAKASN